MSITGGIKFFDKSKCLSKYSSIATASSNSDNAKNILNYNPYFNWQSIDSDDLTLESIEITFTETEINRLFLVNMNFKEFTVKYWDGVSSYIDFTNVVGLDGVLVGGISETIYDKNTAYYEFDKITTTRIKIACLKTQIADEEKFIYNFYCTEEIGTFEGYPQISREDTDSNNNESKVLSGKTNILKGVEELSVSLTFTIYPLQNDYDILKELFKRHNPFLVWLCGGRYGSDYFKISRQNWELKDIFNMQYKSELNIRNYNAGRGSIYKAGFNGNCRFVESVG